MTYQKIAMSGFKRGFAKPLKWLAIAVFTLIVVVVLAGNAYRVHQTQKLARELPPPGRMVSVGSHEMHIHCVGSGSPTVVLDAGTNAFSAIWGGVMERAAGITRLCAFDRSGLGWSQSGSGEITAESRLADLEALLEASGESGPYIFVGWSIGAVFAWLYAQHHPDDAAGLITVDGASARMLDIEALGGGDYGPPPGAVTLNRLGVFPAIMSLLMANIPPELTENLPQRSIEALTKGALLSGGMIEEMQSIPRILQSAHQMGSLGDLPLIVVTHGRAGDFFRRWGDTQGAAEEMWQEMQRDMARQSSDSTLLVAESSDHSIPVLQPEIIVRAMKELTDKYRESE